MNSSSKGQHLVKSSPAHTQHKAAKQTVPDPLPQAQQSQRRQIANHKNYEQRYRLLEAKQSSPVRTRPGRVIKEPVRFQDYFKTKNRYFIYYQELRLYCNRSRVGLVFMNYRVVFERPS